MKTIRLTAGEAIVRYLDNQYVAIEQDGKLVESKFVELFYAIFGCFLPFFAVKIPLCLSGLAWLCYNI